VLERAGLSNKPFQQLNIADLVAAIFNWAGVPVALDDLVDLIADIFGIKEPRELHISEEGEDPILDERMADQRPSVLTEVDQRMYLQRLWAEICLLPPKQCSALLLNLRDSEGRDAIMLLPITGTATIGQIAQLLGMPAEQFASMHNDLPLDDAAIARLLGITRQQVVNLRKSARQRLARRMKGF
jgi:hypothetical protein